MKLRNLELIVQGKKFLTNKASLIAHSYYGDGGTFLLRTDKGTYFLQHQADSPRNRVWIEPISKDKAIKFWSDEALKRDMTLEEAFPDENFENA